MSSSHSRPSEEDIRWKEKPTKTRTELQSHNKSNSEVRPNGINVIVSQEIITSSETDVSETVEYKTHTKQIIVGKEIVMSEEQKS